MLFFIITSSAAKVLFFSRIYIMKSEKQVVKCQEKKCSKEYKEFLSKAKDVDRKQLEIVTQMEKLEKELDQLQKAYFKSKPVLDIQRCSATKCSKENQKYITSLLEKKNQDCKNAPSVDKKTGPCKTLLLDRKRTACKIARDILLQQPKSYLEANKILFEAYQELLKL